VPNLVRPFLGLKAHGVGGGHGPIYANENA
jgi:hypothetical protein